MSAQTNLSDASPHVVDILGNVTGRDQPVMKMDKAVQLVKCLDKGVFTNDNYVFFDPFSKAGEVLLATALVSMKYKNQKNLILMDAVSEEMYQSNRYFALAPDKRHYNLSLRTFYGNKQSHNPEFTKNIKNGSYLSEVDGRLDRNKFNKELKAMLEYIKQKTGNKKIIAVGNPPYQESDGGFGSSASAVYTYFAETLIDQKEITEFILVMPSRWFSTGKGTQNFRKKITKNRHIKSIQLFKDSKEIFPVVNISGGVCFLHYKLFYQGDVLFKSNTDQERVNISDLDVILDDPKGYNLVKKIKNTWKKCFMSDIVWSRKPFGLSTNYFQKPSLESTNRYAIPCLVKGRRIFYADKRDITKNKHKITSYKVVVPKSYGAKRIPPLDQFFILDKSKICTETYNILNTFDRKFEAENFIKYLHTRFVRYFLGLRKITQDIPKDRWEFVPYLDMNSIWDDKKLFNYFKFSRTEQQHIISKEKLWSNTGV